MKVAICIRDEATEPMMDDRFGRAAFFLMVDTADDGEEIVANPSLSLGGGAGVRTVEFLSEQDTEAVVAENVGPNAARALQAAGIRVFRPRHRTARENLAALSAGELTEAAGPTVDSHYGSGGRGRRFRRR